MPDCILVVDDDELTRSAICAHVEKLGYRAIEAGNGIEAIEEIGKGNLHGMILDILMPQSDGIEVLVWIMKEQLTLPVVVFTQTGVDRRLSYPEIAERFGAIKSFEKPISEKNIRKAMELIEAAHDEQASSS